MKKIILFAALLIAGNTLKKTNAQVSVSVNVNIGHQPVWGPVGYDYVEYYYLPDIDVYYWVPRHQFVYISGGHWIFSAYLPVRYRSYDLYSGYKVVINEPKAYFHYHQHKIKYKSYKGHYSKQIIIRNSNDPRYYVIKGHPKFKQKEIKQGKGLKKGKH